ncbi:histone RNA hairpin-binding protein isoform X1 [Anopheles funestus]|uniref:histone RNA hairpin-binding protein isoform X1 n=1 Tax=Anopheles funestus TaxID=62324 RepID=UPI0020C68BFC|nr:histone RNA hairpin-binding protein isoform X1 [Anopheles funestus]
MSTTSVVQPNFGSNIDFSSSWYEPTPEEEEEEKAAKMLRSERELQESHETASREETDREESLNSEDQSNEMSVLYKASNGRQIEIDILDSANVKKYEKLVQNELIKSPFKRRLSGESSSEETDEKNASGMDPDDADGEHGQHSGGQWKRSKKHENDHGSWRLRRESSSSGASSQNSRKQLEYETDEAVLVRRQKQIDYGKNTLGYENYIKQVPNRQARTKEHPTTPQKHLKYSRRAWDGLIRVWRKQLHCFDPNNTAEENA